MKRALLFFRQFAVALLFLIALVVARFVNIPPVFEIGNIFLKFFIEMIIFLPAMFLLIGLFDVWVPKEMIQKHIGESSGVKGAFLVILLAMVQAGPLYGAFPVAYILFKKGCRIRNIFIYLGAYSTLKIPMLSFEIGFLGFKFSLLRTLITLPVFIVISILMEKYLKDKNFEVSSPK